MKDWVYFPTKKMPLVRLTLHRTAVLLVRKSVSLQQIVHKLSLECVCHSKTVSGENKQKMCCLHLVLLAEMWPRTPLCVTFLKKTPTPPTDQSQSRPSVPTACTTVATRTGARGEIRPEILAAQI